MRATTVGLLCLAGCVTYDFEPVTPVAIGQTVKKVTIGVQQLKPNVFLVVDKSGSMKTAVSTGVTRMDAMKSAMGTFITNAGASAHLGVLPFPSDAICGVGSLAGGVALDEGDEDDARMQQYAASVKMKIDALAAEGGTPTGATMRTLASYDPLQARDRANFAVLLTDGLPNCNPDLDAQTCTCTNAGPRPCSVNQGGQVANQCLDDSGASNDIATLKAKGIRTIVVGFGTDVMNTTGASTLASMAAAGGFNRPCTTNTDCNPGDTCNAGGVDPCGRPASTCAQSFFQAGNAAELGTVLDTIKKSFECPACRQVLNASPGSPELISVLVDSQALAAGPDTWQFHPDPNAPVVEFLGATCSKLMTSSVAHPVNVEIRTVEAL